jgi:alpha-L-fucosidase 2
MIFGGLQSDEILLNESSVWAGPPIPQDNPRGPELLRQMRALLFQGKYAEAEAICRNDFLAPDPGEIPRSYKPLGVLRLEHDLGDTSTDYLRALDYDSAVSEVTFKQDGVEYRREAFVSAPGQVLAVRLTASRPGKISFSASMSRQYGALVEAVEGNSLHFFGQASAKDQYLGVKFDALLTVVPEGGEVAVVGGHLKVTGANSVTLYLAAATDYNFADPSQPLLRDRLALCRQQVADAKAKDYQELKAAHVADYQGLYRRSTLDIELPSNGGVPIDRRIQLAAGGAADPELLLVYYRYCRYVFISSSRAGGLPANLQGLWNPMMRPPWSSDYHLNINVQEAYWFAEQGNLAECHEPLFAMTEGLMRKGSETARIMLGCRGFIAPFHTDVWLFTTPTGLPNYGMYVVGGAWCAADFMEHYRFTQDRRFLEERAYPVLRGAALFFTDWLVKDPVTGKLVSGPSASPENTFRAADGTVDSISMGPAHDQEIIWSTFRDYLEACGVLGIENDETAEVRRDLANLALPKIGADGRLMEWSAELQEPEPGHRHLSPLWGFMPGNRITLEGTPELAGAVSKFLDYRLSHDYHAQGWSLGWVSNVMARLKEGDRALDLMSNQYFAKAFPNMFVNAHGQAQVTDMMAIPLAMIELLLQSHAGEVELLPALPSRWPTGRFAGLCARGGFVVDLTWRDGKLTEAAVHSRAGGTGKFRYRDKLVELATEPGKTYRLAF